MSDFPYQSTPKAKCKRPSATKDRWCSGMSAVLSGTFGKGVFVVDVYNFGTGKSRVIGVATRIGGERRGRPLMFNHCPFCGEPILWPKEKSPR